MSLGNEGFISLSKITETQASLGGYFLGKNRLSEEQQKQSRARGSMPLDVYCCCFAQKLGRGMTSKVVVCVLRNMNRGSQ